MFCVDWAPGAADPNYVRAAVNTRLVGKQVRTFDNLSTDFGAPKSAVQQIKNTLLISQNPGTVDN